jgi:putative intracellular protease/amidase
MHRLRSRAVRALLACSAGVLLLVLAVAIWWQGFDLARTAADPQATAAGLDFLASPAPPRGRVLAVVSSTARLANGRRGGFELTELSRAWYVFLANGYAVDIASPEGGLPPAVVDDDDLVDADHAFMNDPEAQHALQHTLALADVDVDAYDALYLVGGKGTMVDFPDHPVIARLVQSIDARGGVIGAVCHGPAGLLGVAGDDGRPWLHGRRVTAFSNDEELFLIEDAQAVFGVLLADRLRQAGARYAEGPMYLEHVVVDGRLVTGQNPWSTWATAEAMIAALGHAPVPRRRTAEELAVEVLAEYRARGLAAARGLPAHAGADPRLILMHALVSAMRGQWHDAFQLQRLARS